MMERIGRVQSRENLLVNVWNYDTDIETRTVDNHMGRLRGKMGKTGDMIKLFVALVINLLLINAFCIRNI